MMSAYYVPPVFFGGLFKELLFSRIACVVSITTSVRSQERESELWLHLPKRLLYHYSKADRNMEGALTS